MFQSYLTLKKQNKKNKKNWKQNYSLALGNLYHKRIKSAITKVEKWRLQLIIQPEAEDKVSVRRNRKGEDDSFLERTIGHLNSHRLSFCPPSDVWMLRGTAHPPEPVNITMLRNATARQWQPVTHVMEWQDSVRVGAKETELTGGGSSLFYSISQGQQSCSGT